LTDCAGWRRIDRTDSQAVAGAAASAVAAIAIFQWEFSMVGHDTAG